MDAIVLTSWTLAFALSCGASALVRQERNIVCDELPHVVLTQILGPAYNTRYMSVSEPPLEDDEDDGGSYKRKAGSVPSFYVEDDYAQALGEEPAWSTNHVAYGVEEGDAASPTRRRRAAATKSLRQWECESKVRWIDLGEDHFPRYLRSVECTSTTCWYGHFQCRPKSFTVKILRRRRGRCVRAAPGTTVGIRGLPEDLKELWVWEERAVNFCCECSAE